jgi:DNA transformation protein
MSVSDDYLVFVQDQLGGLGEIRVKRMFGGAGLYLDGMFFAIVADDVLYFKVDDSNRADYEAEDMGPFRPFGGDTEMSYYEVPADVLEDPDELRAWVGKAVEVAGRKPKRKTKNGKRNSKTKNGKRKGRTKDGKRKGQSEKRRT